MLILALILVYAVMASQYESLRDPFIIMFSVPTAAIGVVLALYLTNTSFNLQAYLGQRIGVRGARGFMPEYRRAHVTASRVTTLEETLVK